MTASARTLHPREQALMTALETLGVLNKREALTIRASYLRPDSSHESLLRLLRERNYAETQLAAALSLMGVPTGGENATADPLHPLQIEHNLPYLPADQTAETLNLLPVSYDRLADALISLGVTLSDDQYQTRDIGAELLRQHVIDDELLTRANALWKGLRYVDLRRTPPDPLLKNRISESLITTQVAIPYSLEDGRLVVAVNNPMIVFVKNTIEDEIGSQPVIVLAPLAQIQSHIHATYERDRAFAALKDESTTREETRRNRPTEDTVDDSSAVTHFIDTLIREAATSRASDIHIQPTSGDSQVRIRIDGQMQLYKVVPKNMHRNIVNRVRAMGALNTSGERKPQDAVIRYDSAGVRFNLRASIVPTPYGGKVSLRLTAPPESIPALAQTDLSDSNLAAAEWALSRSNGMIIMSGPTGSGKTVLSHSLIQRINHPEVTIFTIENPIEIEMPGLVQIQIAPEVPNEDMRTDYPDILRALLRQDPDVIMIGEVRDVITARTAVQAAQTGHLLITTIHSNSAAGVITRLTDMGIEPFNLSGSLRLLIAQRLAGRPCPDCRINISTPAGLFAPIGGGPSTIIETTGRMSGSNDEHSMVCPTCAGKGASGRIGIHEMIRVTSPVERAIRNNLGEREIERIARTEGFRTLYEDGLLKVRDGLTTLRLLNSVVDNVSHDEELSPAEH